jgi:predicted nucleotidyltransferase component of viral defense system
MVTYNPPRIRQAEVAQLIILQSLFSARESREVVFQGGTAIRWFYGGARFSEDLDFVTSLPRENIVALMESVSPAIRRHLVANFGAGSFSVKEKRYHPSSYKAFVDFLPSAGRSKISVKIEFEKLAPGTGPNRDRKIMQSSPAVSYFLQEGGYKAPGAPVIINIEPAEEILSDKLRALVERPYTKGRDFFDLWFLMETLRAVPNAGLLKRKLDMYEVPFTVSTPVSFYTHLESIDGQTREALLRDIHYDLARFLPVEATEALEQNGYRDLLSAVQSAFRKIEEEGTVDFNRYPVRERVQT